MASISIRPPYCFLNHPIQTNYNVNVVVGERSDNTTSRGKMTALDNTAREVYLDISVIKDQIALENQLYDNQGLVTEFIFDTDVFKNGLKSVNCYILNYEFKKLNSSYYKLLLGLRYADT